MNDWMISLITLLILFSSKKDFFFYQKYSLTNMRNSWLGVCVRMSSFLQSVVFLSLFFPLRSSSAAVTQEKKERRRYYEHDVSCAIQVKHH